MNYEVYFLHADKYWSLQQGDTVDFLHADEHENLPQIDTKIF